MGVDTKGYVSSKVTAIDIYNVIIQKFDKNAKYYVYRNNVFEENSGNIHFNFKDENRSIFIIENFRCESHEVGKIPFEDDKYTYLSSGCWGASVEIMTEILKVFSGYLDEDDCDDIEPWETFIPNDDSFVFDEYIVKQNKIIQIIDSEVTEKDKIQIARLIMKYESDLKELL